MKKFAIAVLPVLMLAACATAVTGAPPPLAMKGGVLVDAQGMTVYTYDKDVPNSGKSACNGQCAVNWPPVMAAANAQPQGAFTIVVRDDGKRQWAYKGQPVYTWPEDQEPGDKYGDNKNKVWHVIKQ